jgi:hypothetical protein
MGVCSQQARTRALAGLVKPVDNDKIVLVKRLSWQDGHVMVCYFCTGMAPTAPRAVMPRLLGQRERIFFLWNIILVAMAGTGRRSPAEMMRAF